MKLDLFWPEHRLAVELDLYETHGSRESFEEDRIRQEKLLLEGIVTTRVTGPRFARETERVLDNLRALLGRRGAG